MNPKIKRENNRPKGTVGSYPRIVLNRVNAPMAHNTYYSFYYIDCVCSYDCCLCCWHICPFLGCCDRTFLKSLSHPDRLWTFPVRDSCKPGTQVKGHVESQNSEDATWNYRMPPSSGNLLMVKYKATLVVNLSAETFITVIYSESANIQYYTAI